MNHNLETITAMLVADGKGILAADETVPTLTRRFEALGIASTEDSRRTYREMLFTAPGAVRNSSAASSCRTRPSARRVFRRAARAVAGGPGHRAGIKVDTGAKPLAGWPGEMVTEGLDRLRERLAEYRGLGAHFAKWRAVIRIADELPSRACVAANAHALARYAALCQEQELVPIVEPEVLMDGSHGIERCEDVTGCVLDAVFHAPARAGCRAGMHAAQAQHGGPGRREFPKPPRSTTSRSPRCAACADTSPPQCRGSSSCPAVRTSVWRPPISTRSTGCLA